MSQPPTSPLPDPRREYHHAIKTLVRLLNREGLTWADRMEIIRAINAFELNFLAFDPPDSTSQSFTLPKTHSQKGTN